MRDVLGQHPQLHLRIEAVVLLPCDALLLVLQLHERPSTKHRRSSFGATAARDELVERRREQLEHLADAVAVGHRHRSVLLEIERGLLARAVVRRARRLHDVRPGGRDGVERERVLRPAVLLGDREQQERELLHELGVDRAVGTLLRARQERAGDRQAVALQDRDEVVQHLPAPTRSSARTS